MFLTFSDVSLRRWIEKGRVVFGVGGREGDPQRVLQTVFGLWRANWKENEEFSKMGEKAKVGAGDHPKLRQTSEKKKKKKGQFFRVVAF